MEEWKLLDSRSERKLNLKTCQQFEDSICLYTTRNDAHDVDIGGLQALNQPCARIVARHDGGAAAVKALENHIVLAKGAKVIITRDVWRTRGVPS